MLHVGNRQALAIRERLVGKAAGFQMAKPHVQLVFGLGRAADVELLHQLRSAVQHQDHAAFEL